MQATDRQKISIGSQISRKPPGKCIGLYSCVHIQVYPLAINHNNKMIFSSTFASVYIDWISFFTKSIRVPVFYGLKKFWNSNSKLLSMEKYIELIKIWYCYVLKVCKYADARMSLSIKRMDAPWCVLEEANNFISFIDWLPKKIELLVSTPPTVRPYLTLNLKFTASILLRQRSQF